jgi:hypothetical protein
VSVVDRAEALLRIAYLARPACRSNSRCLIARRKLLRLWAETAIESLIQAPPVPFTSLCNEDPRCPGQPQNGGHRKIPSHHAHRPELTPQEICRQSSEYSTNHRIPEEWLCFVSPQVSRFREDRYICQSDAHKECHRQWLQNALPKWQLPHVQYRHGSQQGDPTDHCDQRRLK